MKRRWLALGTAAVATAIAIALMDFAMRVEVRPSADVADAEPARRRAPSAPAAARVEVPLRRFSRTHLGVRASARVGGGEDASAWSQAAEVDVLLDTGSTVAFGTAHAGTRFPLLTDPTSRGAIGFAGARGSLYPIAATERFDVELPVAGAGAAIVQYLAPAALHGVDVILPPQLLAPAGGAVVIDLAHERFVACASVAACAEGSGWRALAAVPCADDPDVVGVEVKLAGKAGRWLLDTGATTGVFKGFYDRAALAGTTRSRREAELSGMGGAARSAAIVSGDWVLDLAPGAVRHLRDLWLAEPHAHEGTVGCFPDGSLGTDAFEGCELLVGDAVPRTILVRCG